MIVRINANNFQVQGLRTPSRAQLNDAEAIEEVVATSHYNNGEVEYGRAI